jgi:hypothetical protein
MEALIDRPAPAGRVGVRPALYLAIVLAVLCMAFLAKVRVTGIFGCPATYRGMAYLSDCNTSSYGDYDHGAYWFGLEPEAMRATRRARVLFLGNSRIQFAMSSPFTLRWFSERSISFYTMGFSHYESVTFVEPVLDRVEPQARAYVINADRFFAEWLSPVSNRVVNQRDSRGRYEEKRFWQWLHRPVCSTFPVLCGNGFAVYRADANGMWMTAGAKPDARIGVADGPAADVEQWPHFIDVSNRFVGRLPVDRRCVVLTIVPYGKTKRAEAQAIAQALGTPFIAPSIEGLTTFDGSHLDSRSAALWSAAFLEAAGPELERCAGGATAATSAAKAN